MKVVLYTNLSFGETCFFAKKAIDVPTLPPVGSNIIDGDYILLAVEGIGFDIRTGEIEVHLEDESGKIEDMPEQRQLWIDSGWTLE